MKSEAFTRVFRQGYRSTDQFFTMLAAPRDGVDVEFGKAPDSNSCARVGMAISRKVAPLAVARNRIKRQVRESFRLRRSDLPPLDFVVMAKHTARNAAAEELRHSLDRHWKRLVSRCSDS